MRLDTRDSTKHWDGEVGGGCGRNIFCKIDAGKWKEGDMKTLFSISPGGAAQNSNSSLTVNSVHVSRSISPGNV